MISVVTPKLFKILSFRHQNLVSKHMLESGPLFRNCEEQLKKYFDIVISVR